MENQFGNSEKAPVDKQEVINRLKDYGKEDPVTMELLGSWIKQHKEQIRTIPDLREQMRADFAFEIEKIKLYIETGFLDEALEELTGSEGIEGMLDVASTDEEYQQVIDLLDEIESKR
jgi:hypothetical protein